MIFYHTNRGKFSFSPPAAKFFAAGLAVALVSVISYFIVNVPFIYNSSAALPLIFVIVFNTIVAFVAFIAAAFCFALEFDDKSKAMNRKIREEFCYCRNGNPLNLKDGEKMPKFDCKQVSYDTYLVRVIPNSVSIKKLMEAGSYVSAALNKRFKNFVVTDAATDAKGTYVEYTLKDISVDRNYYFSSVNDMKPCKTNTIRLQKGTCLDLTSCGSMIVAGKTRSGKTTAVISILLQALMLRRDRFGSHVMIIDPKKAELSRLPHTYTLDDNGEAKSIFNAVKSFAESITKRQAYLNDMSEKTGDAVKWWNAGMHASFLFIDEYVALRSILPKKPSKDDPEYSLEGFDNILKRIVTMGASAGCFVIISIAEASVQEGGLPSMLRSAMQTKVLFKPTLSEGKFLWDSVQLEKFENAQTYRAGDAWFSSPDGINDAVQLVHFPIMGFDVYKQLGDKLTLYYK